MSKLVWGGRGFVVPTYRVAFVTFATGRYVGHDIKLRQSILKLCPIADVFTFRSFEEIGSPPHPQNPYAFKVYAIETVRKRGYDVIIWCDSVNRLSKSIDPMLSRLREVGVYLPGDGWKVGEWVNDRALEYFEISRDTAMTIESSFACVLGFDFRHPITSTFFAKWKQACDQGIFCGDWANTNQTESQDPRCRGHRHDQSCADLIAYTIGIPKSPAVIGDSSPKMFTSFRFP